MPIKPWFPTFIYDSPLQPRGNDAFARALLDDCHKIRAHDRAVAGDRGSVPSSSSIRFVFGMAQRAIDSGLIDNWYLALCGARGRVYHLTMQTVRARKSPDQPPCRSST